ncbi:esterase [Polaromonas sp. A23]|uniref:esterase n=1 Tax=Polaromonas sp. A23 TaxID=1944133 RepID=UPI0009876706|nr:esterase [Polaromonas sp. A23]OOG36586.1 esterase [Polaromonas sp. A23]
MNTTTQSLLKIVGALGLAVAATGCASTGGFQVKEVGSYHVGGRSVTLAGLPTKEITFTPGAPPLKVDPNGDFEVESLYARYTRLASPKAKYPLMLWHGGGLAGVTFETKPDGGAGWESYFLNAGHDVYVSDAVERGRASWARYPEIFKSEPFFRPKREAWELFRIGENGSYDTTAAKRRALPGTQFPVDFFDQFAKQGIPRWSTNDAATQAAYNAYVDKQCPCVIVVHSQGANFAFQAALAKPEKVKALVVVEPSGSPDPDTTDYTRLRNVPVLWVWGDNLQRYPFWQGITARQERFRTGLAKTGAVADRLALPEVGIAGNTHMVMMDRNSDEVAARIQEWLSKQGLMR